MIECERCGEMVDYLLPTYVNCIDGEFVCPTCWENDYNIILPDDFDDVVAKLKGGNFTPITEW